MSRTTDAKHYGPGVREVEGSIEHGMIEDSRSCRGSMLDYFIVGDKIKENWEVSHYFNGSHRQMFSLQ
ncbi:hypothetical protein RND71_001546 [Anisodus tanguticus]|uniref:Uncharacterized protein n=1 Tax=Anisodus tanguticus TaxID=243964 RepID=A0AAE1T148_9SOLA|nr:hypothetical protein RND71_001546 [Anisodus tanguticus]